MGDENGESMEPMGEEPLVGLVESELERLGLVHGCTGADLGFYKGGCPIHLKGAPPPHYFDPCYRKQTIFWP